MKYYVMIMYYVMIISDIINQISLIAIQTVALPSIYDPENTAKHPNDRYYQPQCSIRFDTRVGAQKLSID